MQKLPTDAVIIAAKRTPFTKAKGSFKHLHPNDLLLAALNGCFAHFSPLAVEDVVLGNVLAPMTGTVSARMACLEAGIPVRVPVMCVNRQCASGLEAVCNIATKIRQKSIQVGMAGGFESMTHHPFPACHQASPCTNSSATDCLLSMGETAEILAEEHQISREEADKYALESQRRAKEAQDRLQREITPLSSISTDEGVRDSVLHKLAALKPAFKAQGVCTAGNSSQLSDGAACVLLASREYANTHKLPVLGVFVDYEVVGVEPRVMGTGPIAAIPPLLERNGLRVGDIALFEINEAFGAQVLCCIKELGIPHSRVNVFGGAVALGHPLGATGARMVGTLLNGMERGYGVVSLCIGTGMGAAALFYKE